MKQQGSERVLGRLVKSRHVIRKHSTKYTPLFEGVASLDSMHSLIHCTLTHLFICIYFSAFNEYFLLYLYLLIFLLWIYIVHEYTWIYIVHEYTWIYIVHVFSAYMYCIPIMCAFWRHRWFLLSIFCFSVLPSLFDFHLTILFYSMLAIFFLSSHILFSFQSILPFSIFKTFNSTCLHLFSIFGHFLRLVSILFCRLICFDSSHLWSINF